MLSQAASKTVLVVSSQQVGSPLLLQTLHPHHHHLPPLAAITADASFSLIIALESQYHQTYSFCLLRSCEGQLVLGWSLLADSHWDCLER